MGMAALHANASRLKSSLVTAGVLVVSAASGLMGCSEGEGPVGTDQDAGGEGSGADGNVGSGSSPGVGGSKTDGTGGSGSQAERPAETCAARLTPKDVAAPANVVGDGSAASCTEAALRAAVAKGGVITFDCGNQPATILVTEPLEPPTDKDTTIDGADRITLDGGGTTRIIRAVHDNFKTNDHVLTFQRMTMKRGHDPGEGFLARNGESKCAWGYKSGGGGAIYVRDMVLHVWGVIFEDNHGPELGPDVAGGAIYVVGSNGVRIASSIFRKNSASNGGGIGFLHAHTELTNVLFEDNKATGLLANFGSAKTPGGAACPVFNHAAQGGAGGLGGAFYSDGLDPGDDFCGVEFSKNESGDLGGALFRSAYWGIRKDAPKQTMSWDRCIFDANVSPTGGGGAAYVNNSVFLLKDSSFTNNTAGAGDGGGLKITGVTWKATNTSFTGNSSNWGGGVAQWGDGPDGYGTWTGLTFTNNQPNDHVGDF